MKNLSEIYTGKIYADEEVLANAPQPTGEESLEFFSLGKHISDDKLEKEYEKRDLVPANLYTLAEWVEKNPQDKRNYVATHWKDKEGKWCYAAFFGWCGERSLDVNRGGHDWRGHWEFSGVRKSASELEPSGLKLLESRVLGLEQKVKKVLKCKNCGEDLRDFCSKYCQNEYQLKRLK